MTTWKLPPAVFARSIASITCVLFLALAPSTAPAADVAVGAAAPAFTLLGADGKEHSLSDNAGKIVVLEWLNHGCPFVRKHYSSGNMQKLQADYTAKGVVWYSIVSSAPGKQGFCGADEASAQAAEHLSKATGVLLDPEGTVGRSYGARTTPHMFIVGTDGALVYKGAIDDKASADPNDVANAKNYVAAALDSLLAGSPVVDAATTPYGCSVKY